MTNAAKTILYSILALLLAAIPASLLARPQGHGFGSGQLLERIADRLELSDQQREQVRAVHEVYREDMEALVDVMGVARRDLQDRVRAETFDELAIREASERVAAVSADLAVLRARIHSDVRQILTPEQIQKAEAMRELWNEFAGERREHHRRGPGRHFSDSEAD